MQEEQITRMYRDMGISEGVYRFGAQIESRLKDRFDEIDRIAEYNQMKVIRAMQESRVNAGCFQYTSGYGYDDLGRETLEKVYAGVFHTQSALVRPQIACGTHALAVALTANLRPGDELLSPAGKPYDTLEEVIGIRPSRGSLAEYGVSYRQVDLLPDGTFDYEEIEKAWESGQSLSPSSGPRDTRQDPASPWRRSGADRICKADQTGCDLHGGQLLRGICRAHGAK